MPRIIPKARTRLRTWLRKPPRCGGGASHILLSECWSWPNTPVAPSEMVTRLTTDATTPALGPLARFTMSWMACAPACPTRLPICPTSSPSAAARPRTSPAIAITSTRSGAIEKTV